MKTLKTLIIIVLIILIIPLAGYVGWQLKKGHSLDIFVVNKSMTNFQGSENKAFNYLLNTEKIISVGNRPYDLTIDHQGVVWDGGDYRVKYPRLKDLERTADKYDLVYYADSRGIWTSDTRKLRQDEENKIVYGGVNNTDYNLIKSFLDKQVPVVAECDFFGPPTDPLVRYNIEMLVDIYSVGWIGKYVRDLGGVPDLMPGLNWKELYEDYTGLDWTANGPGIVMINQEAGRVFVLEEGIDIDTKDGLIVSTDEAVEKYGLKESVNYVGWFSVLHPGVNKVESEFVLNATEKGKQKLNEFGVPENFPALIRTGNNFYFMAGDFGKSKANLFFPKVMVLGPIYNSIKGSSKNANNFFYSYYQPFMTYMVNDALTMKEDAEE